MSYRKELFTDLIKEIQATDHSFVITSGEIHNSYEKHFEKHGDCCDFDVWSEYISRRNKIISNARKDHMRKYPEIAIDIHICDKISKTYNYTLEKYFDAYRRCLLKRSDLKNYEE